MSYTSFEFLSCSLRSPRSDLRPITSTFLHRALPALVSGWVAVVLPGCPSGAETPNAHYLTGESPGQADQTCRTGNRCDGTLRCVDDDNDPSTLPTCRERCVVEAPLCAVPKTCLPIPDDPGNGVCIPPTPSDDGDESGEASSDGGT